MIRKNFGVVFLCLILTLVATGCDRGGRSYPYKWGAVGEPMDSLMNRLEHQFNLYEPTDSILKTMDELENGFRSRRAGSPAFRRMADSRLLYWRARYFSRFQIHDSARIYVGRALELNDSMAFPYDRMRMLSLLYVESDSIDGGARYSHFYDAMKYAKEIGDIGYEAHNSINMGNLLGNIEEYEKGLYFLRRADSLYIEAGYPQIAAKNGINVARLLSDRGERGRGDSILRALSANSVMKRDTFGINTISRNLYSSTKDKKFLLQAYNEIRNHPNYRHLRGLYRALLANHNYWEDNLDSTVYYAELALEDLPYVKAYGHKAIIWFNVGLARSIENRLDSALAARIRYEAYVDSATSRQRTVDIMRLSALQEMKIREAEFANSLFRRNMTITLIALILGAGIIVTYLFLNRRNIRQRLEATKSELELEKAKRKVTASVLSVEEKDRMLETLKAEIASLRNEGLIKEENARRLESTIKVHLAETANADTFIEMFEVVNPGFTSRLKEVCPGLADSYVRLACYILMELDTKRIASLMNIRPESVRQARWRLSQRLRVSEDSSLEETLHSLNEA